MPRFRKKPVEIEAIQVNYTENGLKAVEDFLGFKPELLEENGEIFVTIETLEGNMKVNPNDWIIKGVKGEFYPCKPDIFKLTYDLIDDNL